MENQTNNSKELLLLLFVVAILAMYSCKPKDTPEEPITAEEKQMIDDFENEYFAKYNQQFIKDTNDNIFPTPKNVTAMDFHTWAWHKYLYLTQNKRPDGTTATVPHFLEDTVMYQITDHGEIVQRQNNPLVLELFHQAGSAHPVLSTNPAFGDDSSYTVYYSIHMNDIMLNQMYQNVRKKVAEIDKSKDKQDLSDPTEEYTNGSLELKAAWVDTRAISPELLSNYIVVQGVYVLTEEIKDKIDAIVRSKGEVYTPVYPDDFQQVDVALIGLHVVGKVDNFSELLWATFEGFHLAPDNLQNLTDTNSIGNNVLADSVNNVASTHQQMLLYRQGSTPKKIQDSVINYPKVSTVSSYKYQVYRKYPIGVSVQNYATPAFKKHADIANAMNTSALKYNSIKQFYNSNIWLNIESSGQERNLAVYNQLLGEQKIELAGSPNATNVTMESFMQSTKCFSCHTSGSFGLPNNLTYNTNLNVSHIYSTYFADKANQRIAELEGKNNLTIEQIKTVTEHAKTLKERVIEKTFDQ